MKIESTSDAVDALGGRDAVSRLARVDPSNVSHAVRRGRFPARWWRVMLEEANRRGVVLPLDIFDFKQPSGEDGEAA